MKPIVLQHNPSPDDTRWSYRVNPNDLIAPRDKTRGKVMVFTHETIKLQWDQFPKNRILYNDDQSKFILVSFQGLRFPDTKLSVTADYMKRFFAAGLFLNGVQYRFYHHSNSQLRSRSCFLRQANSDEELDRKIYALGAFEKINNIAKRAKRIGLLFSGAEIDYHLDPRYTADIPDIKSGDEIFSDGCGLISRRLAVQLSKAKRIVFRGLRYTPSVFQIRYLGYKGVVMLHPKLDKDKKHLIQFRSSMKKFTTTADSVFAAVAYSTPYSFGRLNNDIIVLLSSLGISNETLLRKQEEYFKWLIDASHDVEKAIDFLSCLGEYSLVESALLDGIDSPRVSSKIRSLQLKEVANFRKNEKMRVRMMIHKSRLLFGVCDPFKVLREGEIHVRISAGRMGATSLTQTDVLVVRNPCLHPGDCLKLRAVNHPMLSHLVDCVVFASVGRRAAPSMTSGGDLDGDQFLICWDPDLVPVKVSESYTYPPNKESISNKITRNDLANHFASYNNMGLAKVASLHQKWARNSPEGAMSSQCQELNALHSQSVDGARIRIPDRLLNPPETDEPYVIDVLTEAASKFASEFAQTNAVYSGPTINADSAETFLVQLLKAEVSALSEYELLNLARSLARTYNLDLRRHMHHVNFGALATHQKYELSTVPEFWTPGTHSLIWNSLMSSDIVTARDLADRRLEGPLRMQRLYSSKIQGLASFFEYLQQATQDFTRKLIILKTDNRFAVGIFVRGDVPWDEDPVVNDNVVVCSFMRNASNTMSTYRTCTKGYILHCSDNNLQLYNKQRQDTFIFVNRPPAQSGAEIATSIALQKISGRVQQQVGRLNRTPVTAIEIHVISNRDRLAHQLFDLRFDHVQTEEYIRRLSKKPVSYVPNSLHEFDWTSKPSHFRDIFAGSKDLAESENLARLTLNTLTPDQLYEVKSFAISYHSEDRLFWAFDVIVNEHHFDTNTVVDWLEFHPSLVFALLKAYPPVDASLHPQISSLTYAITRNIIRCANTFGIACLAALEKISANIASLHLKDYFELLTLTTVSVRARNAAEDAWLAQEVLLVLDESRRDLRAASTAVDYVHKHALAVAFDRVEEAADECPCDEKGNPTKQRIAPTRARLIPVEGEPFQVIAHIRIDASSPLRLHSHVRLQAASMPEKTFVERAVLDALVTKSLKGELTLELFHPLPPEYTEMDWNLYNAGSVATSNAMLNAILRLGTEQSECCRFYRIITSGKQPDQASTQIAHDQGTDEKDTLENRKLNDSQMKAVNSSQSPLTLIWGPPGTGKTTVVIEILRKFLRNRAGDTKILMTASTHNAVDNVLERFVAMSREEKLLEDDQILRVATDHSKVNKALLAFTIDARVGGDVHQNERLKKEAEKRVKQAIIVFTTCTGAGLGTLRSVDFDMVLIDEASQVTEPCALIPLVKGCKKAVLVGDHVQLRPTVRPMGKALEYDVSLLERLYTGSAHAGMARTMLDVQYRFPERLARFPSDEFYEGKLRTGISDSSNVLRILDTTSFPWPKTTDGQIIPTTFVQCSAEEDMGGSSKTNTGQAELVAHIGTLLSVAPNPDTNNADGEPPQLSVTVLSPYAKQIRELRNILPSTIPSFTIDSFQGRESDVIILSTVRCNVSRDIGFVEDARRLNVAWTRAKLGFVLVGDRATLTEASALWKRAIEACEEVFVAVPAST